ncbi:MAG TPA: Rrf2 family transcriptional regulator [Pirellulales bacterium]|nr:Rrf2 family transcriptional regulator [Pirellulales bacterium]
MFSQTVEYALRAMVFLADRQDAPRTTEQIARVTKVPVAYLSKVMQALNRGELVVAQRGVRGGFRLARSSEKITILDVVNAVEPVQRIRTCPLGLSAHSHRLCPLHKRMDDALAVMERAFRETTLAEVLAEPTTSIPLCDFPPRPKRAKSQAT